MWPMGIVSRKGGDGILGISEDRRLRLRPTAGRNSGQGEDRGRERERTYVWHGLRSVGKDVGSGAPSL